MYKLDCFSLQTAWCLSKANVVQQ